MLKKIGIHFQKENIEKLNDLFPDIKISYLMDFLLDNFIKKYEKELQEFIRKSKEKKL